MSYIIASTLTENNIGFINSVLGGIPLHDFFNTQLLAVHILYMYMYFISLLLKCNAIFSQLKRNTQLTKIVYSC